MNGDRMNENRNSFIAVFGLVFLGAYIVVEAYNAGVRDNKLSAKVNLPTDGGENDSPSEPISEDAE